VVGLLRHCRAHPVLTNGLNHGGNGVMPLSRRGWASFVYEFRSGLRTAALQPDRCDTHGMPTDIYFAGENVRVTVDEDPGQVAEAFASAQGLPFRLTGQGCRGEVYVNPAMVAFWSALEPSSEPEVQPASPQPKTKREDLTDIWGQPLRRKPRR
jgi:hypothetical protein